MEPNLNRTFSERMDSLLKGNLSNKLLKKHYLIFGSSFFFCGQMSVIEHLFKKESFSVTRMFYFQSPQYKATLHVVLHCDALQK